MTLRIKGAIFNATKSHDHCMVPLSIIPISMNGTQTNDNNTITLENDSKTTKHGTQHELLGV
jgi:hypothetical protein